MTVGVGITLAERSADLASALLVLSWGLKERAWIAMVICLAFQGLKRCKHWVVAESQRSSATGFYES